MIGRSDNRRIIDAASDHAAPDEEWLRGLLAALRPVLDRGLGVFGWFHAPHEPPARQLVTSLDAPAAVVERLRSQSRSDGDSLRAAMSAGRVTTLRATLGAAALRDALGPELQERIADALGLFCLDIDGHGLGLGACSPEVVELSPRGRRRLERVAAHLTAAFRARRRRRVTGAVGPPGGTVADAGAPAGPLCGRESLRAAAVVCDRARTRSRDAADVLDLHQALVAGRWSLVDTFERDGKRYLIGRPNAPVSAAASGLSVRETQVVVFAAMGHALKRIAYELGISQSSVATYLRRGLVKLQLPDRIALTRRFTGFQHANFGADDHDHTGA